MSIAAGVLALVVVLLYLPALNYPFLRDWDDGNFILFNPRLTFTVENLQFYFSEPFYDLYTPLPMVSLMIDHALFGLNPLGYRLHNVALHIAAGLFLLLSIRKLGVKLPIAFAATLLWAANPQKVESVVWITERKDVLCGALAFAAIYCFIRSVSARRVPVLAGVLAALAIFAKPAAVPLPGVMIVGLICMFGSRLPVKEYMRLLWLPVAISVAAILWSALVTAKTNPGVLEMNLLIPLHNLFRYQLTALAPYPLNPIHPPIGTVREAMIPVFSGILLLLFFVHAARRFRISWRRILCTLLIVAGSAVPILGFLRYTNYHFCDRYNYLVSAAVCFGVALVLDACVRRRREAERPVKIGLLAVAGIFFYQTWSYLPYWESSDALYACSLAQDRRPNIKALENTVYSALRTGNTALLDDVAARLKEFHSEYGITAQQAENMELFFRAHIALVRQEFAVAFPIFRQLGKGDFTGHFLWPELTFPLLYRDLALVAIADGWQEDALNYLTLEQKARGNNDIQYHLAEAMKAQIRGNRQAQIAAWESVVQMEPANDGYRKHLEILRSEQRNP